MKIKIEKLKKFENWKKEWNKPEWDLWDYANFHINFELFIGIIEIIYPEIIEYNNCIILKKNFKKENFESWKKLGYTNQQIEKVLNHLHIYDLFDNQEDQKSNLDISYFGMENFEYVAKMILKFWKFSLTEKYPNKDFDFIFSNDVEYDYGPTIYFCQRS